MFKNKMALVACYRRSWTGTELWDWYCQHIFAVPANNVIAQCYLNISSICLRLSDSEVSRRIPEKSLGGVQTALQPLLQKGCTRTQNWLKIRNSLILHHHNTSHNAILPDNTCHNSTSTVCRNSKSGSTSTKRVGRNKPPRIKQTLRTLSSVFMRCTSKGRSVHKEYAAYLLMYQGTLDEIITT